MTLLLVAAAVLPIGGQSPAPPIDLIADGGILGGGPIARHPEEGAAAHVTWFAGLTARTTGVHLGRGWDFGAGAALRREPAFAMARSAATVTPAYFDALTASTAIQFAHRSAAFETAVVGQFSETRFDRAQRLMRAANTINDWAFLVDALGRFAGSARGTRRPRARPIAVSIVRAFAGVQHNQRLHRAGDLEGFDDPTGRVVGGIYVTPWRLRNARGEPVVTAGGGIDGEAAIRGGERLPAGFRVRLRAEVDLRHCAERLRPPPGLVSGLAAGCTSIYPALAWSPESRGCYGVVGPQTGEGVPAGRSGPAPATVETSSPLAGFAVRLGTHHRLL